MTTARQTYQATLPPAGQGYGPTPQPATTTASTLIIILVLVGLTAALFVMGWLRTTRATEPPQAECTTPLVTAACTMPAWLVYSEDRDDHRSDETLRWRRQEWHLRAVMGCERVGYQPLTATGWPLKATCQD